jgi:hypothetical protein
MNHLVATHAQYVGFGSGMFPPGVSPFAKVISFHIIDSQFIPIKSQLSSGVFE